MKNNKGLPAKISKEISAGFTIIEGLLILVIVGILGGTGWFVWNSKNKTDNTLNQITSTTSSAAKNSKGTSSVTPVPDPTVDWIAYSNKDGQYSLKYPKTWMAAPHPELCNPGLLLLGADSQSVGVCASGNGGQMEIISDSGDMRSDQELTSSDYTNITKTSVTVNGVAGEKMSGKLSINGTQVTKYIFYTNSRTYTAVYSQASPYPDVLSDFDLMVTKTLKFSN